MNKLLAPCFLAGLLGSLMDPQPSRAASAAADIHQVQPADYVVGSWQLYRSIYMSADGRIIDRENGSISHSEGQGYGMLIAVAAGDRQSFDTLWNWTERELLVRDDSLAAWKWDPAANPHVPDMNNATDGDLLIAWALLRAWKVWGVKDHLREARDIVEDVVRLTIADSRYGKVLLPGVEGFTSENSGDGPVVNMSYWVFPAIAELEQSMPELKALDLRSSGMKLLHAIKATPEGIPSDWTGLAGEAPRPAEAFPPTFGYNAVRIPLYIAWETSDEPALLRSLQRPWTTSESGLAVLDVTADTPVEPMVSPGYDAINDVVSCSLGDAEPVDRAKAFEPSTYYSSTLHILSLMALSERYAKCF
ncbi:glycosyl hydrolase family 8 [Aurantimonas sp. A2-1-M11]|uniref:glycosyl hydrolase family 8 n=1 Tax=Aurantimonas sp. A2-1-M11 TaxID=3113712 RepID=UPI002F925852